MSGETDLDTLLRGMSAELQEGLYVFVAHKGEVPQGFTPRMIFQEAEATTLIMLKSEADAHDLPYEFPCRMITLNVHSALEAVGFLARITTALAGAGMGVNPVAGFYHDHLFIPDGREQDALNILNRIATGDASDS